jgi:hypothetical protein
MVPASCRSPVLRIKPAGVGGLLVWLLVIHLSLGMLRAAPAVGPSPDAVPSLSPPLLMRPVYQPVTTAPQAVNGSGGGTVSNTVNHDPYEKWVLQTIDDLKRTLQNTNLNEGYRRSQEWMLRHQQESLAEHQAQVQKQLEFTKSVHADLQTAWTNILDPISESLTMDVARCQQDLADPLLTTNARASYQAMLEDYQQKLADHTTNARLWMNMRLAKQQHWSPEQTVLAKRQLADYLAVKLGVMQGKTYPPGMSLEAVMKQYRRQVGGSEISRRNIVVAALALVLLAPLAVFSWRIWRRRINHR